jgi:hypothetical protein
MVPRKNRAKDLWQPKRRIELMYKHRLKQLIKRIGKSLIGLTTANEIIRELKKITNSEESKK